MCKSFDSLQPKEIKKVNIIWNWYIVENNHWWAFEIKMCHHFKKGDSNVNETEVELKGGGDDQKTNHDGLSVW